MRPAKLTALLCATALLALGGGAAVPALASQTETVFFEAPRDLLGAGSVGQAKAIAKLQTLGVRALRIVLYWRDVAPKATSKHRPHFNESSPSAYNWGRYDQLIDTVSALHWKVLLTVSGPVPRWATAGARDLYTKPSAKDFGLFMRAVGRHYGKLVKLYSIWNEPNQPQYLRPQYVHGKLASAALYRSLFLAGYGGLKASGNFSGMRVLMGETSPVGVRVAGIPAPLEFLRGVLCLDTSYRPVGHCAKLPADGYAQHPYSEQPGPFWAAPTDDVTVGTIGRLVSALDRAAAVGAIRARMPVYVTEFGVQSFPNRVVGVSLDKQAEFQAISEKLAWSNPRVVSFDQYLLRDDPPVPNRNPLLRWPGFESGLETYKGTPKPVFGGFRLPLVVTRTHSGVSFWGLVRPVSVAGAAAADTTGGSSAPAGGTTGPTAPGGSTGPTGPTTPTAHGPTKVELQYSNDAGRTWRKLLIVRTDARGAWTASGHFAVHRMWRVRWSAPAGVVYTGAPTRAYTTAGKLQY